MANVTAPQNWQEFQFSTLATLMVRDNKYDYSKPSSRAGVVLVILSISS